MTQTKSLPLADELISKPTNHHYALTALILGAVFIGFAPIFAKHAVNTDLGADGSQLSPVAVACWRMLLAAPIFALGQWHAKKRLKLESAKPGKNTKDLLWLMLPGLCFAFDLAVWHTSFEYTSVANATLLANLASVIVAWVSWIWFGERFGWLFIAGTALAFLGMFGLLGASFIGQGNSWIGDTMGLFVASAYSGYLLSTKRVLRFYSVKTVMLWSTSICGFFLAIMALATPGRFMPATLTGWLDVIALAIVSQVAGQGLIAFGMSYLPASFSAVTLIVQPVCAAIFGWIMLSQALSWTQVVCGMLVLIGIYLAKRGSRLR